VLPVFGSKKNAWSKWFGWIYRLGDRSRSYSGMWVHPSGVKVCYQNWRESYARRNTLECGSAHFLWCGYLFHLMKQKIGSHDPLKSSPSSPIMLSGWSSNSIASLVSWLPWLDFEARIFVMWNCMRWSKVKLCSANTEHWATLCYIQQASSSCDLNTLGHSNMWQWQTSTKGKKFPENNFMENG
jgi:hypothetical protein